MGPGHSSAPITTWAGTRIDGPLGGPASRRPTGHEPPPCLQHPAATAAGGSDRHCSGCGILTEPERQTRLAEMTIS